jgi:hypothetical protein
MSSSRRIRDSSREFDIGYTERLDCRIRRELDIGYTERLDLRLSVAIPEVPLRKVWYWYFQSATFDYS